jgi:hypothetical protein
MVRMGYEREEFEPEEWPTFDQLILGWLAFLGAGLAGMTDHASRLGDHRGYRPARCRLNRSGFEIQEIDHREGCHDQAKAPDQHVAHRGSALRAPRFDCGLNYLSVFLLRHFFLLGPKETIDLSGFNRGERTRDESHVRAR